MVGVHHCRLEVHIFLLHRYDRRVSCFLLKVIIFSSIVAIPIPNTEDQTKLKIIKSRALSSHASISYRIVLTI